MTSPFLVNISPICPHKYPDLDKAFMKLFGPSSENCSDISTQIHQENSLVTASLSCCNSSLVPDVSYNVELPMVHSVSVQTTGLAPVSCTNMVESIYCHLTTEHGDITVGGVKTEEMILSSETGSVMCNNTLQGDITITTTGGHVHVNKKVLGPRLSVTTDTGNISVGSCYSDNSVFVTKRGNIELRNLHCNSKVSVMEEGDVVIQGLDGAMDVFVKKGGLDVSVSRVREDSRINIENGDILLKLSDTHPIKLSIAASQIILDEKFSWYGNISKGGVDGEQSEVSTGVQGKHSQCTYLGIVKPELPGPTLQITAGKGKVVVESQSWAASLGFNFSKLNSHNQAMDSSHIKNNRLHSKESWDMQSITENNKTE